MRRTALAVSALLVLSLLLQVACSQQSPAPAKPAETALPNQAVKPAETPTPSQSVRPIELRLYFQSVPGTSFDKIACTGLPDRIAKATNGKVKVILMPDLVKPADAFQALKDRRVDAIWFVALHYTSTYPWVGIGAVPGFWDSEEQYDQVQRQTGFLKQIDDWTMKEFNARTLVPTFTLSQVMYSKRPLSKIEDFQGFKMRTASAEQAQLMTELGAKPTTVAWAELYMGLQTGVVDGAITGLDSGYGSSFYEVVGHVTDWPSFRILNPRYFAVNEDYWQALPADVRTALERALNELSKDQIRGLKDEYNTVVKNFRDKGTTVTLIEDKAELDKGRPAALKVGNDWISRAKQKGYQFPPELAKYLKDKGYSVD